MKKLVLDPRIYSRADILAAADYARSNDLVAIVLGNPAQELTLKECKVRVEMFEDYPVPDRLADYRDFLRLASLPLLSSLKVPASNKTCRCDFSPLIGKADVWLLWLIRWALHSQAHHDHHYVWSRDEEFSAALQLLRIRSHSVHPHPSRKENGTSPLTHARQISRDSLKLLRSKLLEYAQRKSTIYCRTSGILRDAAPLLARKYYLYMGNSSALATNLPKPRFDESEVLTQGQEHSEGHRFGEIYRWLLARRLSGSCWQANTVLAESIWLRWLDAEAYLVSDVPGPIRQALETTRSNAHTVGAVQHGAFVCHNSPDFERDALFSDVFFTWYRDPKKHTKRSLPEKQIHIGYPKASRSIAKRQLKRNNILIAPSQRRALLDGLIFSALTYFQHRFHNYNVDIRLKAKHELYDWFGSSSQSLETAVLNSDIVITDMSTIAVDAIALGRPAVVLNLFKEENHYETSRMFPVFEEPEQVGKEVERILSSDSNWNRAVCEQREQFDSDIGILGANEQAVRISEGLNVSK